MIKFLGFLSVIIFWVIVIIAAPIFIIVGVVSFSVASVYVLSSFVYEVVSEYLVKKFK